MPAWISNLVPILLLLGVIALVLWRLPKVDLGHSQAFKTRRFWNWFPLGLTYAFLYFGRYNVNELTSALGAKTDNKAFGIIFAAGTIVYGVSFIINGPLTDKLGGRTTILLSAGGAAIANFFMAGLVWLNVAKEWTPPEASCCGSRFSTASTCTFRASARSRSSRSTRRGSTCGSAAFRAACSAF
jgi:OPA family glycerol-3-phosphate transporter-like MFS transporter